MICYLESTRICKTHSKQGFSILISDCRSIWKHMFARLKINSFKSQQITIKWISLEISKNPKDFICNTAAVIYLEQTTSCSSFSRIAVLVLQMFPNWRVYLSFSVLSFSLSHHGQVTHCATISHPQSKSCLYCSISGKNRDAPEQKRNVVPVLLSFRGLLLYRRKKLAKETTYLESLNK